MIAYISGKLLHKAPTHVLIDVQGLGYEVRISPHTYTQLQHAGEVALHTHFHVKEDAQTLYGFQEQKEKDCFLALISVKGVGPNVGMMVLSALRPAELQTAILQEDVARIKTAKGVGTKVAQRIVLELKDRLAVAVPSATPEGVPLGRVQEEALSALMKLGLPKPSAQAAIQRLCQQATTPPAVEELIKQVLQGG